MAKNKRRETSKLLLWTVVITAIVFTAAAMIVAVIRRETSVVMPIVCGGAITAIDIAVRSYNDRAAAKDQVDLKRMETLEAENAELKAKAEELRAAVRGHDHRAVLAWVDGLLAEAREGEA